MEQKFVKTHFVEINLSNMIDQLGEDAVKIILSSFMYLECEDNKKLLAFYNKYNFRIFGKRTLDRDETDVNGDYLVQLFAIF